MLLKSLLNIVKNFLLEKEDVKESKPAIKEIETPENKLGIKDTNLTPEKPKKPKKSKPNVEHKYKIGEYYVVNVCALYILSEKEILFTGDAEKLITETKKLKYRPFVVVGTNKNQIMVIALSTYKIRRKPIIKFDQKNNCKFISQNCFLSKRKKNSDVFVFTFEKIIKRNGRIKKKRRYKFQIPISVLEDLRNIKNSKLKEEAKNICGFHDNYILLKKCANCNVDYVNAISKELVKYKR